MKIKNLIILIGPPGSGKGTQGKLLAPLLNYNYLSMGSTLREHAKWDSKIKKMIDAGKIIPDDMIRKIVNETISDMPQAKGLILDGFPRDIAQAIVLDEAIFKYKVDKVVGIFLDVPKSSVMGRLKKRKGKEARADDHPEVIETRFLEYDQKTHPLVAYFEKHHKLVHINGDQPAEDVHAEILKRIFHASIRL